ncbi:MAG: NAD(P)-binding protein [Gammaproteobacteria bacterium]|nr:NAD(P)-binding protein [Gammaproteobacteria bacterium]
MSKEDKDLGLNANITRRDFLQGSAVLCSAAFLPSMSVAAKQASSAPLDANYYPPLLNGLRGSHSGSFEVAHALAREARRWANVSTSSEEPYDLVVVGGGISGLSSAWLYREAMGEDARILILDNHDDFGGHAKRNEFELDGQQKLAWGGSINLEYPGYSSNALSLLKKLGVDFKKLVKDTQFTFSSLDDMGSGLYFDADSFGKDVLIKGFDLWSDNYETNFLKVVDQIPISDPARQSLIAFLSSDKDLLAPMNDEGRVRYLRQTLYTDFLKQKVGLSDEVLKIFSNWTHGLWGASIDVLPVYECLILGLPGYHVIGELPAVFEEEQEENGYGIFPDGNASVARLLVRSLIPDTASGNSMDDIVSTRFHYDKLDKADSNIRIRLNSTAIETRNISFGKNRDGVSVIYVQNGQAKRVSAKHCVLACYHNIIPHLCPELPEAQIDAIAYPEKAPMIATNILLRNGEAMAASGVSSLTSPGRLHAHSFMAAGINVGNYDGRWKPEKPAVLQFFGSPSLANTGKTAKEQYRAGRHRLLGMTFADFEKEVRQHLAGAYGAYGFDPARDIKAITVNRWPHGYAYEYISSEDPDWNENTAPHLIARQSIGNIAIANSDASAFAYVDGAIDAAYAAIDDLLG